MNVFLTYGKALQLFTRILLISILLFFTAACGDKVTASFLTLSDIHFNPFSTCNANHSSCLLIQKLRVAPVTQWTSLLQQYSSLTPSQAREDTNIALLNSTFNQIKKLPKTYQFVIFNGDLLGHNYQQKFQQFSGDKSEQDYQQFVNKTYQYLHLRLQQLFPNIPVYITLGNNDSYNDDYYSQPNGKFYKNMTQLWQDLIPDQKNRASFAQTFPDTGYYAITLPTKTQITGRVIFLNTVLFSTNATGPGISTAAQQELNWLQQQLKSAQQNKQHVWLVYHIPDGVDTYYTINRQAITMLWQPQYNEAFLKLLNQYPNITRALITSHIHMDAVQLMHLPNRARLLNTFIPSISPIYGNNPAFKVYEYYPHTMRLKNFQTYYLNESTGNWKLEYDFNKVYQPYCKPCHILSGYSTIEQTGWRTEQYKKYFGVSTNSQYITKGYWLPYYWCAIQHQTKKGYQTCVDSVNGTNK